MAGYSTIDYRVCTGQRANLCIAYICLGMHMSSAFISNQRDSTETQHGGQEELYVACAAELAQLAVP